VGGFCNKSISEGGGSKMPYMNTRRYSNLYDVGAGGTFS
jgi:hypothetical protein